MNAKEAKELTEEFLSPKHLKKEIDRIILDIIRACKSGYTETSTFFFSDDINNNQAKAIAKYFESIGYTITKRNHIGQFKGIILSWKDPKSEQLKEHIREYKKMTKDIKPQDMRALMPKNQESQVF